MGKLINDTIQIFNKVVKGALITIGNTCTIIGDSNNQAKEFIKANGECTEEWSEIGSSSYLELPLGSNIKFAILEWHSTIANTDLNGIMKNHYSPIQFSTPIGNHILEVDKDSSNQAEYIYSSTDVQSVKWIDVTEILKETNNGYYTVKKIPVAPLNNSKSHNQVVGWSLSVVYENNSMVNRNISINLGIKRQNFITPRDSRILEIKGFKVPLIPRKSYITIVASNGSPNFYSALNIYNDKSSTNNITLEYSVGNCIECRFSNPNNTPIVPHDNVFSGIIMDTDTEGFNYGKINTKGTLGNKNNDAFNTLNQPLYKGNRAKLDILSFDISEKMHPNQESLFMITEIWNPNKYVFVDIILYAIQVDTDEEPVYEFSEPELELNDILTPQYILNDSSQYVDENIFEDIDKLEEEKGDALEYFDLNSSENNIDDGSEVINSKFQDENRVIEEIEDVFEDFGYSFDLNNSADNVDDSIKIINNKFNEESQTIEEIEDIFEGFNFKDQKNIEHAFEKEDVEDFEEIEDIFEDFDYGINALNKENNSTFGINENNIEKIEFTEKENLKSFKEELDYENNLSNLNENYKKNDGIFPNENEILNTKQTIDEIDIHSNLKNSCDSNKEYTLESFATTNNILVIKNSDKNTYYIDDIVTFTIQISNNSSSNIDNVILIDNIPVNSSLVADSLTVSGTTITGDTLPITGIKIGTITPNTTINIIYSVKFYSPPINSMVQVNPKITFIHGVNGISTPGVLVGTSNVITVVTDPIGIVELYANRNTASSGDVVIYSLVISNNGNKTATNVKIIDNIPLGLSFIANSLIVNGVSVTGDLNLGIIIPDIPANSQTLATFKAKVI